uniref:Tower domain-containing protein n=1 Tax=Knipowitschia caucasica TaxID=637954 RepID=A0AAV2LBL0_KNICA
MFYIHPGPVESDVCQRSEGCIQFLFRPPPSLVSCSSSFVVVGGSRIKCGSEVRPRADCQVSVLDRCHMEVCMEWPSGTLARIIGPHVWKDLGPLDPDWFTTLTCEAKVAERDEPSIEEDLCPNQEAALFKSQLGSRGRCSPLSSTPRVFRPNQALSPQSDHSLFAQPETPLNKESDAQRSSSFDLFAHLHSPLGTDADRTHSPPRSKGSYVRELSERLGAQMGGVSWSSSFNTPPAGDSTWNITRRETESTLTLTENTSVLARKLFHCNHNLSEDGPVLHPPVVTHDADITSPNPNCKNLERPLSGTKNASSPNCSSGKGVFRKVKSERIHRRLFAAVTEPVRDGVESPVKQAESEASDPAEHPPLTQWSPLSLSGLPTEFFSPSVCLSAMKRAKVSGKQESVRQPAQTYSSLQPAQTDSSLRPAQTCSSPQIAQPISSPQPAQAISIPQPAQAISIPQPAQTGSSLQPARAISSLQPAQTLSSLQPAQPISSPQPAQTFSSLQLTESIAALLKAKALLDEAGSSANAKETSQISKKPLLENRNKKHVPSADGLDMAKNSGFSTASGKKVGVSEEALNNAIGLFNDVDRVDKSNITRHARSNHGEGGPQASSILNPPVKMSKGVFHPRVTKEVAVPSALVNLDGLQLRDCSSTQQQFLAQEALDCTRALLEDEVRAGQSLTVTSEHAVKPAGRRVGQPDESVGRKPSPERSDRALAELRPPPVLSALGGLLKDRRVFQYHVSRQPNAPRPRGCVKEQATVPLSFTSVKREAAEPNRHAFVPPFLNPKTKACKEGARTDQDKPCTFVPPFKKHKSDVHENNSSRGVKGLSDTHTFRPPTPKEPNPKEERELQMEAPEPAEEEESARAGQGLNEGTGEEATHDHVGSMADLARDLQDMRIRKKRRQTIRALPGSVFLSKTSGLKRLSLRAAMNGTPQKYSPKELYEWGVDQQLCEVTSQTAQSFCLDLRRFYQPQCFFESGAVQLADGGWLVPRRDGTVGKEEFYKALCDTPGVDPQLISPLWVYNHYRWIVWKLASLERAFPKSMGSVCLGPEQLLLQLKYRYDVEVDHSRRSALRRIFERDDTAAKTMVLCVCGPFSEAKSAPGLGQGPGQDPGLGPGPAQESPTAVVWLTDGWYSIKCQLDVPLTSMLQRGHITEGVKLMVHGAQLIGSEEACGPLEAPDCLSLKICANSTRRARWDTRLGYYRDPRPFVLPLSSLFSTGGAVGSVDMVILRIYPQQWMERKVEGGLVFRSGRAEEKEARRHLQQKEKHLERLYAKIRAQFDQEERDGVKSKGSRRSVRLEELSRLQEGEELYEAVGEELAEVEPYLSSQQLHALCLYKRDALEQRQKQLQERLRRAVEQEEGSEGSFPRRQVTPVWRLSIADYQDPRGSTVYQLSVWSPSAELQSLLKEGGRYRTYNLTATEPRSGAHRGAHPGAGRATVQLTATRKTRFTSVQASPLWLSAHFRPRDCVTYTDLQNPDFLPVCGEVDLAGAVVSITDQHGPSPAFYLALECLSVVRVRCGLGPSRCEWDEVLQPHALLCITNLQVRFPCGSLPTLHTGDLTELSTQPREAYLQQGLSRLRQAVQDQGDFFTRAEQSVRDLSWSEGQTMNPRTPRSRGMDQRSPQTTPTSRPQTTAASPSSWEKPSPVFKTPGRLSCLPQKKDPRSSKRRRALDHLSRYAPPPPLPPLSPAQHASPHVNKTFCPPRCSRVPASPAHTKGEAGPVCTSPAHTEGEGWVHDDELAMIDTQELRAVDSLMD